MEILWFKVQTLTGLRPDSIQVWDLYTSFREKVPDVLTLPLAGDQSYKQISEDLSRQLKQGWRYARPAN